MANRWITLSSVNCSHPAHHFKGSTISRNGTEQIETLFHGTERNGTDGIEILSTRAK